MSDDSLIPFSFPAVASKKISAAFDGGRITSDAGVMLLAQAERRLGIADKFAAVIADPRNPLLVTHTLASIYRARILAIACGYEDADDLDHLRKDPAFKLACARLPDGGDDLCSQPTMSRWENAPTLREIIRLSHVMLDIYCASYDTPPAAITLDIDDTCDIVHGHQQLSLFNAFYDERCFLPIHVYDTATGRPVAFILRPGKTPSGVEVRGHLRRIIRRIRRHWPETRLTIRGDSHYGRHEAMEWCENNGVDYVFGLAGNEVLEAAVRVQSNRIIARRGQKKLSILRGHTEIKYSAKSWNRERRTCVRIEDKETLGTDIRFVVTNITEGSAKHVYARVYCARGQMENLIKLHKSQLASDRTSCRAPLANQMRLILHTAAYWLMLTLRDAIPKTEPLAVAEFTTLREKLLKIGARVTETASRIRLALATACPQASLFRELAIALAPSCKLAPAPS
jgi:hypothetical protein